MQARSKVRLVFPQFFLGPGDWIRVYDGSSNSSLQIVKYDGWRKPTDLVSSGRHLVVIFQSDGCGQESVIRGTYQAINCGGLIRLDHKKKSQQTVEIESPRYPRLYPNNANCLWTVVSKETLLFATITVKVADTEFINDFLKINDSLDSEAHVYTYTGKLESVKRHEVRYSPGLSVHFVSDNSIGKKGFRLTVQATTGSTCIKPTTLVNGRIAFRDHKRRLRFYCCTGYRLVGVDSWTCVNGRWSPSTLPQCVQMTSCPSLVPPDYSLLDCDEKPNNYGSVVQFRCRWGYRFVGTTKTVIKATCQCSGLWKYDPVVPQCEEFFQRSRRSTFSNQTVNYIDEGEQFTEFRNRQEQTDAMAIDSFMLGTVNIEEKPNGFRRARAVTVNQGCSNIIYAIDCSEYMGHMGYTSSIAFIKMSISLFDLHSEQANIALFFYDRDQVYIHFRLGEINSTEESLRRLNTSIPYCGGTGKTSPSHVLWVIADEIKERAYRSCKTTIFVFTHGYIADCNGDLIKASETIKRIPNVEVYAVTFGTENEYYWDVLSSVTSNKDYIIAIRKPEDVAKAVQYTHDIEPDYSGQCGMSAVPKCRVRRIVGGCSSKFSAWPWMAGIYINEGSGFRFLCGGSLVEDCWILTAAHCASRVSAKNIITVLGDTVRFLREYTEASYEVEAIYIHLNFDPATFDNDIALLKLKCNVQYSSFVRKICLPSSGDEQYYVSGTSCITAGWGSTRPKDRSLHTSLKHVTTPVQNIEICRNSTTYTVTDSMFCAGTGNKDHNDIRSPCTGDAGGPFFCRRKGQGPATYVLIGIVSWGEGCGGTGKYDFYAHVMRMMPWIESTMRNHRECNYTITSCPPPKIELV